MATLNIMKISLQSGDLKQILQEPVRSHTFVARKFSTFSEKDTCLPAAEFLRCSLSVVFKHLFFKTVSERKLLKNTWPKMKNVLFPRLCNCVEYCITTNQICYINSCKCQWPMSNEMWDVNTDQGISMTSRSVFQWILFRIRSKVILLMHSVDDYNHDAAITMKMLEVVLFLKIAQFQISCKQTVPHLQWVHDRMDHPVISVSLQIQSDYRLPCILSLESFSYKKPYTNLRDEHNHLNVISTISRG